MTSHRMILALAVTALLVVSEVSAQPRATGTITGMVLSTESGQPLPFAAVTLEGTSWGTTSGSNGRFSIKSIPPGTYTVHAKLLGFEGASLTNVVVEGEKTTRVLMKLTETSIPLGEIEVRGTRTRDDVRPSILAVEPFRVKRLPGVAEDVFRTLQSLPGVLSPNDFSSQLVIRGSGPDENLIIMDDIEIFNPYRLYGLISMFNPETVSDINLVTGGFSPKYGDRLSAVLDITNREGDRTTAVGGSLNASISNANFVLNGRSPLGLDGSYIISARRTYYDLIVGPIARKRGLVKGDVAFPNFGDVQAKVVFDPWNNSKIVLNGIFNRDGVDIVSGSDRREVPDSLSLKNQSRNDVLGIAWHYYPSPKFFLKLGFSWYRNSGETEFGGDFLDPTLNRSLFENTADTTGIRFFNVEFDSRFVFRKISLKNDAMWLLPGHMVEAGAGIDFIETGLIWHFRPDDAFRAILRSRGVASLDDFVQTKENVRLHLFVQDRVKLSHQLSLQVGFRIDYFEVVDQSYLQPRINLSYLLDPLTSLRAAWGIYRQSPGYEKLFDQDRFFDLTNASLRDLRAEQAIHYVLGIERWLTPRWRLKFETYLKDLDDIVVQQVTQGLIYHASPIPGGDIRRPSGWSRPVPVTGDSITTTPINGATGRSYGFEFLLEKKNLHRDDQISGWISYAFAKSSRVQDGVTTPFRFDQRHTVNVVLDYRLSSWLEFGVRWKYGSNFPYTLPIGIKPRIVTVSENNEQIHVLQTDGAGNVIFDKDLGGRENKFSARLPEYHRLDVRLTAKADYWGLDWSFYLDIMNVYNRKNIIAYRFYVEEDLSLGRRETSMIPLLPTIGFSVRF